MSVIRVNKTANYTVMSNYHFKDKRLSLKAKGLLSQMLSLPPTWDYTIAGLVAINQENESAIKSALKELKDNGYLVVTKKMPNETGSGRIEYIYDIYEHPLQVLQNQQAEKQGVENLPLEVQQVEDQGQLNTDKLSTYNKINKNKVLTYETEFEDLWKKYPKKAGKEMAKKDYIKARKDGVEKETIEDGMGRYIEYLKIMETEDRYIKNGSTWFHQRCWDDDYTVKKVQQKNPLNEMIRHDWDYDELEKLAVKSLY